MLRFADFEGQSRHIGFLHHEFAGGTYSHAYLFSGPKGTGKRSVAQLCAMTVLCKGEHAPCGECGPCRRVLAGTHPDVHVVEPESGKRDISVGVMRDMLDEVEVHSFEDGAKVFIIPEADRLNVQAQNCLLKTLEEPPEKTVFILCTDKPSALLPTIVSRLRLIRFHPLDNEAAAKRLVALGMPEARAKEAAVLSGGCVGTALAMDDAAIQRRLDMTGRLFSVHRIADIPAVTNAYKDDKLDKQAFLDTLEGIVRDILASQASGEPLSPLMNAPAVQTYASNVPLSGGLALMDSVREARKMLGSYVTFTALLESILLTVIRTQNPKGPASV